MSCEGNEKTQRRDGVLGLDAERVETIRRNLAAEPSVTGKRYAGLRPA